MSGSSGKEVLRLMKARLVYFASMLSLGLGFVWDVLGMSDGSGF
jgi:hypothetical protein